MIFWYGVATSVADPDKDGRVQMRIHGLHDDETNIPNTQLPWSKPLHGITSAAHNKMGHSPVGAVVGSTAFGFFLDKDHQYPIHLGFIAKAGDAASGTTSNGSETLVDGTNSNPPGSRLNNNKFITRKGKSIKEDDATQITYPKYTPTEQKDSDGKDITQDAIDKTKFSKNPTIGSISQPIGSVLTQLQQVDPQNLNGILKKAIPSFIKISDLSAFSPSAGGSSGSGAATVLGQALGMAMNAISSSIGQATVLNSVGNMLAQSPSSPSPNASQALYVAISSMGATLSTTPTVGAVIVQSLNSLISILTPHLQNGTLTLAIFEALIAQFLAEIQSNGTQATLGIKPSNILNELSSVLPTIAGAINTTLQTQLPLSVLSQQNVTNAISGFSLSMAFLKAPTNGKKALATDAVQGPVQQLQQELNTAISGIQGITSANMKALSSFL